MSRDQEKLWRLWVLRLPCLLFLQIFFSDDAYATAGHSILCSAAARIAAHESNVPFVHLMSLVEQRAPGAPNLQSEPWLLIQNGERRQFDDEVSARKFVFNLFRSGDRNFKIGCFQVSYASAAQYFSRLEDLFDPLTNARFASAELARIHEEGKDWLLAIETYLALMNDNPSAARICESLSDEPAGNPNSKNASLLGTQTARAYSKHNEIVASDAPYGHFKIQKQD